MAYIESRETSREKVRRYFREVIEQHKLPSLPVIGAQVLRMIDDPDLNIRDLARVLSDDPALSGRIFAASRSAYFGQRKPPSDLQMAIQVLGLGCVRGILITAATQRMFMSSSRMAGKLWSHSLAVALTARILTSRVKVGDTEWAFFAGLLHDIGQLFLLHGDRTGYERMVWDAVRDKVSLSEREREIYGFDHEFIGMTLLDAWNIDSDTGCSILRHHDSASCSDPTMLATILNAADYLCFKLNLGFYVEPPVPRSEVLTAFACATEEGLDETLAEILEAFNSESALFNG